ncbi:hypothetical protein C0J52_14782 [Blattella germanica]|nr:hypothetical protein C0J52_14782 [Blattella germanica]
MHLQYTILSESSLEFQPLALFRIEALVAEMNPNFKDVGGLLMASLEGNFSEASLKSVLCGGSNWPQHKWRETLTRRNYMKPLLLVAVVHSTDAPHTTAAAAAYAGIERAAGPLSFYVIQPNFLLLEHTLHFYPKVVNWDTTIQPVRKRVETAIWSSIIYANELFSRHMHRTETQIKKALCSGHPTTIAENKHPVDGYDERLQQPNLFEKAASHLLIERKTQAKPFASIQASRSTTSGSSIGTFFAIYTCPTK